MALTAQQTEALVKQLEDNYSTVDGWVFTYEFQGICTFTKGDRVVTADWDFAEEGQICFQVNTSDGFCLDELNADIPYGDDLTAEKYVDLIKPYLIKSAA